MSWVVVHDVPVVRLPNMAPIFQVMYSTSSKLTMESSEQFSYPEGNHLVKQCQPPMTGNGLFVSIKMVMTGRLFIIDNVNPGLINHGLLIN